MSIVSSPPPAISGPEIARLRFGPTETLKGPDLAVQAETMSSDGRVSVSEEAEKGLWETREMILSVLGGVSGKGEWLAGERRLL